jgi:hypothetical protein
MVLSLQSGLRSIRQRIPELAASGQSQRKPKENYVREFELQSQKETKGSYKKYRSFSMLYKHFPEKWLDFNACPFFTVLRVGAVTRGEKRSKNMHFLLHVGEPLFHYVQRQRFVGVRGSHDRRVRFLKEADEIWIKFG